ncbi:MAG: hypothetical protein GVY17_07085 [Cyanobacteria bacterium]|jgi:hypothetical protein|nr:hypothetical protein [Cyanobacteria bacterium GSL.Bin21]
MNTQLINSLVQLIHSLSPEERAVLEEKLFFEDTYPSPSELITLSLHNKSLNFLAQEPDLYTLDDGEPIR